MKGLNALDDFNLFSNPGPGSVEPADQGLCAGNGFVMETNNQGEIMVFNPALNNARPPISLDTLMGLTSIPAKMGGPWSSGGDPSCLFDANNGGHWFITEIVSASSEAAMGPFAPNGCFTGAALACYEGIAVSVTANPLGSYYVYYFSPNYNPSEPGYPYLLNDFAKIATTRDAFLMFYDEFPLRGGGLGGGFFNGAQEIALTKFALELGLPAGSPSFNMAIENMGLFPTPDGTCAGGSVSIPEPGVYCWYQVIPGQSPDPTQFDNSHGGSGFMLGPLDFIGQGDSRIAVFDWTGLINLNSFKCATCSGIGFGGQLFSGVDTYYNLGFIAAQKSGPIPLGTSNYPIGFSNDAPIGNDQGCTATCPEGGIATNGDGFTQVSYAQGQIWGAISTQVEQTFTSGSPELHMGAAYWVIGTGTFDRSGLFSLTSQAYVTAMHEDLEFPAMAATGSPSQDSGNSGSPSQDGGKNGAIIAFTLSGNDYYPSTAYGRLTSTSGGLTGSVINIADLGQSPQDGFTEYQCLNTASPTAMCPSGSASYRPRWGDYSWAIASGDKIYFATNYIQYPNCSPAAFAADPTCGGTRAQMANWGTSVNFVVP